MQSMAQITGRKSQGQSTARSSSDQTLNRLQKIEKYNQTSGGLAGYDCKKCLNKGHIMILEDGSEAVKECGCMKVRRAIKRIEKSGMGDLMKRCTFGNFKTPEAWQADAKNLAQSFLSDYRGSWFFAGGQVGSGKTHLCTALAGEFLKQGKPTRYMRWRDDAVRLKAVVTDGAEYGKRIAEFKQAEVLYIDDFFKTPSGILPTAGDVNIAFEILNYRYNNQGLITVISSEYTVDDLMRIDEAVGSRVYERSKNYCLIIPADRSKNYRMTGGKYEN